MQTQPFTPDDLYLHLKPLELDIAPDATEAACTVRAVNRADDRYQSAIWSFPLDGRPPLQLTQNTAGSDSSPRWSPDGSMLAFISPRIGSPQVHTLARRGGEAVCVGHFASGVSDLRWCPDGTALLVVSGTPVDPDLRGTRGQEPPPATERCQPEVAWKLPYKSDGVGYLLQREVRLFRLELATGAQTQLTNGPFDVLGFDPAPDGSRIAYTRTRAGRFAHCTELWMCQADGSGHAALVENLATVAMPIWSPDGRHIAFTGARKEGDGQSTLWIYDVAAQRCAPFADESLEVAAGSAPHWNEDGTAIVFAQAWRGRHRLVRGDLRRRTLETVVGGDRQFGAFGYRRGRCAYSVEHPGLPGEVWTCDAAGGERQVSDLNPWWRERTPVRADIRSFDVPDGRGGTEQIEGWLIRAEGTAGSGPLLDDAHGGPASYALMDFDSNVFWQVLCSQGWTVLALNAVGSSSYGREFCERLAGHWGEYDLPQHQAAIAALQQEGLCNSRVALSGKSYGGFFSAWAIGHTDTFGAAVVMAPVGNIETHYGTSDGGYYADPLYLGMEPAFDRELARRLSPLQYVERSKTPTLFLQGKDDERCPKCQSEELFVSMMRAGDTPTELVLYPGEGHSFLASGRPSCRADAARRVIDWIEQHTSPDMKVQRT